MMPVAKAPPLFARLLTPLLAAALALLLGASCGTPVDYGDCVGGVIIDGVCEGRCTPDKCLEQNTCVGNRCVLLCSSHEDCRPDGVQSCAPAVEDDTGAEVFTCQPSGVAAGPGAACLIGDECARYLTCPAGGGCLADQCGGDPGACAPDEAACEGVDGCTTGVCPDGSSCRSGCAADCAPTPGLECESIGEGDTTAYCTLRDCATDGDCIAGFHCGVVRVKGDLCGPTCAGAAGAETCQGGPRDGWPCDGDSFCQKGNDEICGEADGPCLSPGEAGATAFEGSQCLLRRSCLRRGPGAPCASSLDCSRVEGQTCASLGGELRCATVCTSDFDCVAGMACDVEQSACVPRFGAWVGTGQFCEPCFTDEDCGSKGSTAACAEIPGGERACFDHAYAVPCTTDADCPLSPGGRRGACLDEGENEGPSSPKYHRCYLPIDPDTMKTSCW